MVRLLTSFMTGAILCTWVLQLLGEQLIRASERQIYLALGLSPFIYETSKILLFVGGWLFLLAFSARSRRKKYELPNSLYKDKM